MKKGKINQIHVFISTTVLSHNFVSGIVFGVITSVCSSPPLFCLITVTLFPKKRSIQRTVVVSLTLLKAIDLSFFVIPLSYVEHRTENSGGE
jgi:hypothetical protein